MNAKKVFSFKPKLDESRRYTAALIRAWNEHPKLSAGGLRLIDLQDTESCYYEGDCLIYHPQRAFLLELKIESGYTSEDTDNLAIEVYSDFEKRKRGGAWQSNAHWYAHLYTDGLLVLMWRTHLVQWLNRAGKQFRQFRAQNEGCESRGLLVPRQTVKSGLSDLSWREWVMDIRV